MDFTNLRLAEIAEDIFVHFIAKEGRAKKKGAVTQVVLRLVIYKKLLFWIQ